MAKWEVVGSDRNYNPVKFKTFTESSQDAPETAERAAREHVRKLDKKDEKEGKYRSITARRVDDSFKNQTAAFQNGRARAEAAIQNKLYPTDAHPKFKKGFDDGMLGFSKKESEDDNYIKGWEAGRDHNK